jgi:hypothetical protein
MPTDEVALAELRQANARYADYRRWLAEIDRRLKALEDREEALRVLAYVDAILNLELPPPSDETSTRNREPKR